MRMAVGWLQAIGVCLLLWAPAGAAQPMSIGTMLVAIDVNENHVQISQVLHVANPGPPTITDLRFALPRGAQYVTFHYGLSAPRETADGFADRILLRHGITEIAYSYALPTGRREVLSWAMPLPVQRLEIVVRGAGVSIAVRQGRPLPPVRVGNTDLLRWERRGVPSGERIVLALDHLPVTNVSQPPEVALVLASVLAVGLAIAARRKTVHPAASTSA